MLQIKCYIGVSLEEEYFYSYKFIALIEAALARQFKEINFLFYKQLVIQNAEFGGFCEEEAKQKAISTLKHWKQANQKHLNILKNYKEFFWDDLLENDEFIALKKTLEQKIGSDTNFKEKVNDAAILIFSTLTRKNHKGPAPIYRQIEKFQEIIANITTEILLNEITAITLIVKRGDYFFYPISCSVVSQSITACLKIILDEQEFSRIQDIKFSNKPSELTLPSPAIKVAANVDSLKKAEELIVYLEGQLKLIARMLPEISECHLREFIINTLSESITWIKSLINDHLSSDDDSTASTGSSISSTSTANLQGQASRYHMSTKALSHYVQEKLNNIFMTSKYHEKSKVADFIYNQLLNLLVNIENIQIIDAKNDDEATKAVSIWQCNIL